MCLASLHEEGLDTISRHDNEARLDTISPPYHNMQLLDPTSLLLNIKAHFDTMSRRLDGKGLFDTTSPLPDTKGLPATISLPHNIRGSLDNKTSTQHRSTPRYQLTMTPHQRTHGPHTTMTPYRSLPGNTSPTTQYQRPPCHYLTTVPLRRAPPQRIIITPHQRPPCHHLIITRHRCPSHQSTRRLDAEAPFDNISPRHHTKGLPVAISPPHNTEGPLITTRGLGNYGRTPRRMDRKGGPEGHQMTQRTR